jgi:hypothetical protein
VSRTWAPICGGSGKRGGGARKRRNKRGIRGRNMEIKCCLGPAGGREGGLLSGSRG